LELKKDEEELDGEEEAAKESVAAIDVLASMSSDCLAVYTVSRASGLLIIARPRGLGIIVVDGTSNDIKNSIVNF